MRAAAVSGPIPSDRPREGGPPDAERPIDLVHLARATDGDESLEAELLAMFDRQAEKLGQRVQLADLPRRARADIAHRLRGSALAIGAFAVGEAAGRLEAAFEGEGEPLAELSALAQAVAEARRAIAELAG
jgi:HPt (histidine-containing phosphotransfer) domain-containing protein